MAIDISRFTFGVEIESIVERTLDRDDERYASDERFEHRSHILTVGLQKLVRTLLSTAGIPTNISIEEINSHDDTRYLKWSVDYDKSINVRHTAVLPRYKFPAEFVSPVYTVDNFFSAFTGIWDVIEVLTTNDSKLWVNPSMSLHVHIGNGNKRFEFEPALAIAQLVTAYESQIEMAIHPRYLADNDFRPYCLPPSTLPSFRNISSPCERAAMLRDKVHDIPGLVRLMNSPRRSWHYGADGDFQDMEILPSHEIARYYAYNFLGMDPKVKLKDKDQKPTIEFRQHHATVDPYEISNWVHLILQIVFFAHTADRETLDALLSKADDSLADFMRVVGASDGDEDYYSTESGYTLADFMRAIGCDDAHVEYYSNKTWPDLNEERPSPVVIAEGDDQEGSSNEQEESSDEQRASSDEQEVLGV
ncbi:hypothetical protein MMC18_002790 [Xylographa bjoerkii]|nr:hypothetical protein [Xylographa bjoerkii]